MGLFPSPEWVAKNKRTAEFKNIVESSWGPFVMAFNDELQKQYIGRASQKLSRSTKTDDSYSKRSTYRRAHDIEGSANGTKEDVLHTNMKGVVSGLLLDTMRAELRFDGNHITILSPMVNNHYKKIISNMGDQPGLKSYYLSKFLASDFGFISSGRYAWGPLTQPFRAGSLQYNAAKRGMNEDLARLEQSKKRGKYKKRRK